VCRLPAGCLSGWGDCNANASDGCETSLETLGHCGGCGSSCALELNATVACTGGACLSTCNGGGQRIGSGPSIAFGGAYEETEPPYLSRNHVDRCVAPNWLTGTCACPAAASRRIAVVATAPGSTMLSGIFFDYEGAPATITLCMR